MRCFSSLGICNEEIINYNCIRIATVCPLFASLALNELRGALLSLHLHAFRG